MAACLETDQMTSKDAGVCHMTARDRSRVCDLREKEQKSSIIQRRSRCVCVALRLSLGRARIHIPTWATM